MAVGDRSRNIRQNVMSYLKDDSGLGVAQLEVVYDAMNRVQRRICEIAECVEDSFDLNILAGQERYTLPPDFLRERIIVPDSAIEIKRISMDEVGRLKRAHSQSSGSGSDLLYYYKWNNEIGFLDVAGSEPSAASTVTVYYWRIPDTVSEVLSDTIDPILDYRWDTALFYGTVADLNADDRWEQKFDRELQRVKSSERTNQNEPGKIPVTGDYE